MVVQEISEHSIFRGKNSDAYFRLPAAPVQPTDDRTSSSRWSDAIIIKRFSRLCGACQACKSATNFLFNHADPSKPPDKHSRAGHCGRT